MPSLIADHIVQMYEPGNRFKIKLKTFTIAMGLKPIAICQYAMPNGFI